MSHCDSSCESGPCDCASENPRRGERYGVLRDTPNGLLSATTGVLVRIPANGTTLKRVAVGKVDELQNIAADLNGEPRPPKGT